MKPPYPDETTDRQLVAQRPAFRAVPVLTLLSLLIATTSAHTEEFRTWKDASGTFSREARFERLDAESKSVCLAARGGGSVRIALARLGEEDQKYAVEADNKRLDAASIGAIKFISIADPKFVEVAKKTNVPLPKRQNGVWVINLPEGGPAWTAGVREADVIYAVGDTPIKTTDDLFWSIRGMEVGQSYDLHVERLEETSVANTPSHTGHKSRTSRTKPAPPPRPNRWGEKVLKLIPLKRCEVMEAVKKAESRCPLRFTEAFIPLSAHLGHDFTDFSRGELVS
jgi:hypothetical protein